MTEGYIFDYGGTIDTAGCHWGIKIWHTYQQLKLPITEQQYRKAYVYAEQTLGKTPNNSAQFHIPPHIRRKK